MNEFQIIDYFFARRTHKRDDVLLGIGDDAALLQVPVDTTLAVAMDTLVAGVHFSVDTLPQDIAYKSLAVNLSDLAAMGAVPAWVTLALTLPDANSDWLTAFSQGFFGLMDRFGLQLVGGDTTRGPLTITVQVHGFVSPKTVLRRDGVKLADRIYVTGTLGDAGLALRLREDNKYKLDRTQQAKILQRLNRPDPRVEAGLKLAGIASSAIDISDGLAADLGHILTASGVGACVYVDDLPLSSVLRDHLPFLEALQLALNAGDDYELCFTVSPDKETELKSTFHDLECGYTCIGTIEEQSGLRLLYRDGRICEVEVNGFQHF